MLFIPELHFKLWCVSVSAVNSLCPWICSHVVSNALATCLHSCPASTSIRLLLVSQTCCVQLRTHTAKQLNIQAHQWIKTVHIYNMAKSHWTPLLIIEFRHFSHFKHGTVTGWHLSQFVFLSAINVKWKQQQLSNYETGSFFQCPNALPHRSTFQPDGGRCQQEAGHNKIIKQDFNCILFTCLTVQ